MKLLRILLYIGLGLLVLIIGLGLFAKKDYHVERSIEIRAPKALVYDQLRYFKNFKVWSPWDKLDPNMQYSINGQDGEPGAVYQWSGNDDVGAGTQTIRQVSSDRIDLELEFNEPFQSKSPVFYQLEEKGENTKVSWGFDVHFPFPINVWAMFTNINNALGKDYERGLVNLQKVCDSIIHPKYRGFEVQTADLPLKYYVGIRKMIDTADVTDFYMATMPKVGMEVQKSGQPMDGHPTGLFWTWGENGQTDMAATMPMAKEMKFSDSLGVFQVGGAARVIEYYGGFQGLGEAHAAIADYLAAKKLTALPPSMEEYVTDPMVEKDTAKWLTRIIYFVVPKTATDSLPPGK
ncbi:MAG: SRPBCC family protein [Saprospiraceae bacterium]